MSVCEDTGNIVLTYSCLYHACGVILLLKGLLYISFGHLILIWSRHPCECNLKCLLPWRLWSQQIVKTSTFVTQRGKANCSAKSSQKVILSCSIKSSLISPIVDHVPLSLDPTTSLWATAQDKKSSVVSQVGLISSLNIG